MSSLSKDTYKTHPAESSLFFSDNAVLILFPHACAGDGRRTHQKDHALRASARREPAGCRHQCHAAFVSLHDLLAAIPRQVRVEGEYWRLFTAIAVHADLRHFLANALFFTFFAYLLYGSFGFWVHPLGMLILAAIIHKFGVSVDFLRKFRAESVFRCDYKASKLVEPNRDEARAPSGNSSARRGLYICVGAGSQGTVRWDTDDASVMRRAFVRDKTMPGAPRCDEKFPEQQLFALLMRRLCPT